MEPLDFVRIFRQRWKIIVAAVLISAGIAWFTTPETPQSGPTALSYTATATLIQAPGSSMSLPYIALLATKGTVPKAAADALGYTGDPAALAATVSVTPDTQVGTLSVTVNDADGTRAAKVANTYGNTIIKQLAEDAQTQRQAQIDELTTSIKSIQVQLTPLQSKLKAKPGDIILQAQLAAYQDSLKVAINQLVALYTQAGKGSQLSVLQSATPLAVASTGFAAPRSHRGRLLLGIGVGLILGLLLALLIDRIDTRLRRREEVEKAFRLPVVAEVPHVSRRERRRAAVAVIGDPVGRVAEAFRSLRTALTMWPSRAIASRDVGSGARHRTRAVEQEPEGRAGDVGPSRGGQDDHGRQPGRDAGRDRQAGPGDRRRLPQPVHAPDVRRLGRRRARQPARARVRVRVRVRPGSAGTAHRRHADPGADGGTLRRVPRRSSEPHRGRHRGGPDVRRRGRHRRRPPAEQQRHTGLPCLRRLGRRRGQARPGQPAAGRPGRRHARSHPGPGARRRVYRKAAPVRRLLPSVRIQGVVRVAKASGPGQGSQRGRADVTAGDTGRAQHRVRRRQDVLWRVAGSLAVLLPSEAEVPLVLAGSGAALWDVLAEPLPADEVALTLARRHGVSVDAIRDDVEQALTEMSAHGLLQEVE